MRKKIIIWILMAGFIFGGVTILLNNKNNLESKIIKDEITAFPVTVEKAHYKKLNQEFKYVATTQAFNDIDLISETQGRVLDVKVENGNYVSKGSVIAQVDDELLRANFKLAESSYEKAKRDLERYETLFKENNISVSDLENARIGLKNAEAQFIIANKYLDNARITSPINGIISTRYINVGSTLAAGAPIANIVDISRLKVSVPIPERVIKKVKKNQNILITSDLYSGKSFTATVTNVGVKADASHNYTVEALLNNSASLFNAGMFVYAGFNFNGEENALVIPRDALVGSIKDPKVFVVEKNIVVLKQISVSGVVGESIHVLSGINAGDKVVLSGQNNLEDGVTVFEKSN